MLGSQNARIKEEWALWIDFRINSQIIILHDMRLKELSYNKKRLIVRNTLESYNFNLEN